MGGRYYALSINFGYIYAERTASALAYLYYIVLQPILQYRINKNSCGAAYFHKSAGNERNGT